MPRTAFGFKKNAAKAKLRNVPQRNLSALYPDYFDNDSIFYNWFHDKVEENPDTQADNMNLIHRHVKAKNKYRFPEKESEDLATKEHNAKVSVSEMVNLMR